MTRRGLLGHVGIAASLVGFAQCAKMEQTGVELGEALGVLTPTGAISFYGIVKGMVEIALIADPGLDLIATTGLKALELLATDVQSDSDTASTSVTQLVVQGAQLLLSTAQVVTVVPNKVPV